MTIKTTDVDNNAFVAFLKRNALVIVLAIGYVGWQIVEPLIGAGAEVEFQNKIIEAYKAPAVKEVVKEEFEANMTDPVMLGKVLSTPTLDQFTEDAGKKIQDKVVSNVLKEDSTKISMISGLGQKTGIRDEDVMNKMGELLDAWNKGELMTKDQADRYIEREINRGIRKNVKPTALKDIPSF